MLFLPSPSSLLLIIPLLLQCHRATSTSTTSTPNTNISSNTVFIDIDPSTPLMIHYRSIKPKARVAFIFAGSPRSFVHPLVHETIRIHLINAFCHHSQCIGDIFARVSLSDNTHQLNSGIAIKDSVGISIARDEREKPKIESALYRIRHHRGVVQLVYTDVGSAEEKEEMESKLPSLEHKIFRTLDSRRYSMYYGRWSAYMQAKDYEAKHNITYDWFVHVRFDFAWGHPIKSYHKWDKSAIYAPNLWPSDVPDTFALLPAEFAGLYFSMDAMVSPKAMCLGGPNFDVKTLDPTYLTNVKGFTAAEVDIATSRACKDVSSGWSEAMLGRKLQNGGISLREDTLRYITLFMYLVRKDYEDLCKYMHPKTLIGWMYATTSINSGIFSACSFMVTQFKYETDCDPVERFTRDGYKGSCLLNKEVSDWNFMSYRIRLPKDTPNSNLCLTAHGHPKQLALNLSFTPCIETYRPEWNPEINITYSMTQLFYFIPLSPTNQVIYHLHYTNLDVSEYCMETTKDTGDLYLTACPLNKYASTISSQMKFQVKLKKKGRRFRQYRRASRAFGLFTDILHRREAASFEVDGMCASYDRLQDTSLKFRDCEGKYAINRKSKRSIPSGDTFVIERTYIAE